MTDKQPPSESFADLRRRAEEKARAVESATALSFEEVRRLVHELQVHQIELEMQNEELRRTQAALEISRERYFDLFNLAPVGYFSLSELGLILEANLTGAALLGVEKRDLINRPFTRFIFPEDQDTFYRHRRELQATGSPRVCELRMQSAHASPFWARFETTMARDGDALPILRIAMSNVTERRQAEDELRRARDELEQRVKERTAELSTANDRLLQEHHALEQLLRASDHERQLIAYEIHDGLAQDLASAIMHFQAYAHLKDARPEESQRAYDDAVALLHRSYGEARNLISGVRPPILDEAGVMAAIVHLVRDPATDQAHTIQIRSRVTFERLAPLTESAVFRIVQEGLTNACKHSRSSTIRISCIQWGDRLRIKVRDWGIGFNPDAVPNGRFGLAGIRERARLLDGQYRIKSRPGEGTSVIVDLPLPELKFANENRFPDDGDRHRRGP